MTDISNYFLKKLKERSDGNFDFNLYADITQHLWEEDEFSKNIKSFIITNSIRQPEVFETDEQLLKSYIPSIKQQIKYEGLNFITVGDLIEASTRAHVTELEKEQIKNIDHIIAMYLGVIIKDKTYPVAGFMAKDLYNDFENLTIGIDPLMN